MALLLFNRKRGPKKAAAPPNEALHSGCPGRAGDYVRAEPTSLDADPLKRALQAGRLGHVLAVCGETDEDTHATHAAQVRDAAAVAVDEAFALVPEGFASLAHMINDQPGCPETTVETEPFLLARHAVTHADFQHFVDDGGYDQLDFWPRDIWPHLIDFKDATQTPGPRYWRDGRHEKSLHDHPVVGVCQFEAQAYARWAGFRLPTEAEWQMAATWRIRSAASVFRRCPWGDALDTARCNVWATGVGGTMPVHALPDGATPNKILQMIGNIWEWTEGVLEMTDHEGGQVVGDMSLAPVRGGAFDTYFPSQASGCFRTGLVSLARTHNAGFRCAMSLSALAAGDRTSG